MELIEFFVCFIYFILKVCGGGFVIIGIVIGILIVFLFVVVYMFLNEGDEKLICSLFLM